MPEFWRDMKKRRFKKLHNGYKMDRWFFQVAMWMTFVWLFTVAYSFDFSLDYFQCGMGENAPAFFMESEWCDNPFYEPASWKNERTLPPGKYGTSPGVLFYSTNYVPIALFLIAGVLNHLIHNRRREK